MTERPDLTTDAAARPPAAAARPWRIALADDHAIVRMGYRRLIELEADLQVLAEYGDAEAAWTDLIARRGSEAAPDLLILDLSMPGRSGLDLLKDLATELPDLRVLVVSMHDSPAMQTQCLRAGARAFVSKASDPQAVIEAVQALRAGDRQRSPSRAARAPHEMLTVREFEVLQHLVAGLSVEAIARRMGLSEKTVSNYQTLVRQKLDVGNSVELLHYAQRHGLMP
jgi:DNA-binding NarL/FixJ family response regulator